MWPQPGQVIADRYLIGKQLSPPGVWTALDQTAGNAVRLTQIDAEHVAATDARRRQINALRHPALAGSLELSSDAHGHWLIESGAAPAFVPTETEQFFSAAMRVAEALVHAHQQGVYHGQLGPSAVRGISASGVQLAEFAAAPDSERVADLNGFAELLEAWLAALTEPAPQQGLQALIGHLRSDHALTMAMVRDHLDDLRLRWQRGVDSPTLPAGHPTAAQSALEPKLPPASGGRRWLLPLAGLAALVALVFAFSRLPSPPEPVPVGPAPASPVAAVEPVAPEPEPPTPEELEQLLQERGQAQAVLDELINLQLDLREQAVEVWGATEMAEVAQAVAQGEAHFKAQEFAAAATAYQAGRGILLELEQRLPTVLQGHLEAGELALQQWRAADAAAEFGAALAIDQDNQPAALGQRRSATLDQARELFKQARTLRRNDQLVAARDVYQQLQALDPLIPGTAEALSEINASLRDEVFRAQVSEALAALEAGRWAAARAGFQQAERLRPNQQVVREGLLELRRRQRETALSDLKRAAELAVAEQDWERAVAEYEAMLAKDSMLASAQQGRQLASERAKLDRQLSAYLSDPGSWLNDQGRRRVAATLAAVGQAQSPGSKISNKARLLAEQLQLSRQPVAVEFESDNACEVLVYRVARLGQFASHRLELLPGSYVAVGARSGFRDVRREFLVAPGESPDPVVLRCDEPV